MSYIKALSACPLNWGAKPRYQRSIIEAGVNSCYHPLYEIEQGITTITYNPETRDKKIPLIDFYNTMGRTKHMMSPDFEDIVEESQREVDRRWERLKAKHDNPTIRV